MDNEMIPLKDVQIDRRAAAGEVLSMQGDIDEAQLAKIAEQRVEFFRKVCLLSLRRTSTNDWADLGGKPYLQSTGAEKLMALWGIYTKDVKVTVEMDVTTGYPAYEVTGRVGSRVIGTEMDVVGGRNANDSFFQNQLAKTGRLDLLDVRKAAYSNWLVNAVTRLIGMRGLTWEEIAEFTDQRIRKEVAAGKVKYETRQDAPQKAEPTAQGDLLSGAEEAPKSHPDAASGPFISEPQQKRLFAIAMSGGWTKEELAEFLKSKYKVVHSKDIRRSEYESVIKDIQGGAGR